MVYLTKRVIYTEMKTAFGFLAIVLLPFYSNPFWGNIINRAVYPNALCVVVYWQRNRQIFFVLVKHKSKNPIAQYRDVVVIILFSLKLFNSLQEGYIEIEHREVEVLQGKVR